jgi:hypothetical protein
MYEEVAHLFKGCHPEFEPILNGTPSREEEEGCEGERVHPDFTTWVPELTDNVLIMGIECWQTQATERSIKRIVILDTRGRMIFESIGKPGPNAIVSKQKENLGAYCGENPSVPSHEELLADIVRLKDLFKQPILLCYLMECHAETMQLCHYKKLLDGSKLFTGTLQESFVTISQRELNVKISKERKGSKVALQDSRIVAALLQARIKAPGFNAEEILFCDCMRTGEQKKRKNYDKNRKKQT